LIVLAGCAVWVVGAAALEDGGNGPARPEAFSARRIIVRFAPAAGRRAAAARNAVTGIEAIDGLNRRYEVVRMRRLHAAHAAGGARGRRGPARSSGLGDIFVLDLGDSVARKAVQAYRRERGHVVYAEPDYVVHVAMTPDDPYYASSGTWGQSYDDLWGLKQNRLDCAPGWDVTQGAGAVVAVIDTGGDYLHSDLAAAIWENPGEIADNLIDDDGNGYVDDWIGWNFATYGGGTPGNNPWDGHGHGTHCAGTIAAVGNNATGIIGVAPQARVMILKGLGDGGSGYSSDLAQCVVYAVDNGADVLSCSFSGSGTSQTMTDAFNYAYSNGVVSVAAAGNNNADVANYRPANIENVIAVAATDANDAKASFSNYGTLIDVAAPGVDILSLRATGTSMGSPINADYTRANGTSMACPHAAGVCALILAATPGLAPDTVRAVLRATADDIGAPGVDIYFGHGRINARYAAEFDVTGLCFADITAPTPGPLPPASSLVDVTGSAYGDAFSHYYLEYMDLAAGGGWIPIADSAAPVVVGYLGTWDVSGLIDGDYSLNLRVLNTNDEPFVSTRQVSIENASITAPVDGRICNNKDALIITGTATGDGFMSYVIEVARDETIPVWSAADVTLSDGGLVAKVQTVLGAFDATSVTATGNYLVRLTVNYAGGRTETEIRGLYVDVDLAAGWPVQVETITDGFTDHKPYFNLFETGDGDRRLVVSSGTDVHLYDALGNRLTNWWQSSHGVYHPLAVADLDGDGSDDMVTNMRLAGGYDGEFAAYDADGNPLPGWPVIVPLPGGGFYALGSSPPAVGDLDADGSLEVVTDAYNRNGYLTLYALHADGSIVDGWPVDLAAESAAHTGLADLSPALADLDGDGTLEVIIGTYTNGLHVLRCDGTPQPGWPVTNPVKIVNSAVVGDLDDDGQPEIVIATTGGRVYAFEADGAVAAGWPVTVDRSSIAETALADLDHDGDLEVVFSGQYAQPGGTAQWEMLYVYHHDGSPAAGWPRSLSPGMHASVPVVGDVDGDGDWEIVACRTWYGLGAFHHTGELAWHKEIGDNVKGRNQMLLCDLDDDGLLELVAGNDEGYAFVWDLAGVARQWATYKSNRRFTGAYDPDDAPPINQPPVLHPVGDKTTGEGEQLAFTVTGEDPDGDALRFQATGLPAGASFTDDADDDGTPDGYGSFDWTPTTGQTGVYSVTFSVTDGFLSDAETNAITVTNVNDAPVAQDDAYDVAHGTTLNVAAPGVLGNDSDPDADAISAALLTDVSHGTLSLSVDGSFSYTPANGYAGPDGFTYEARDAQAGSAPATVSLTVAPPGPGVPVASDDAYELTKKVNRVPAPGVMSNDSDPDGDQMYASLVTAGTGGELTLYADGSFTYRPSQRGAPDSFQYRVTDQQNWSAVATVTINGPGGNTAPVADDQSVNAVINTAKPVTLTASDADNDPLTYSIVAGPAHGALSGTAPDVIYTPAPDYVGDDSFTFKANDGTEDSNVATVSITVSDPGQNQPPVAVDDAYSLTKKNNRVPAPGVLGNDSDPDGDALTAILVTDVAHGTLSLSADGSFTYKPTNRGAPDSFQYKVSDGLVESVVVTVTIN